MNLEDRRPVDVKGLAEGRQPAFDFGGSNATRLERVRQDQVRGECFLHCTPEPVALLESASDPFEEAASEQPECGFLRKLPLEPSQRLRKRSRIPSEERPSHVIGHCRPQRFAVEVVAEDDWAGRMMNNEGKSRTRVQHPRKLHRRRICIAVLVAELADRRAATFVDEGQGFDRNLAKDFDIRT